jgi:hypothetical protein
VVVQETVAAAAVPVTALMIVGKISFVHSKALWSGAQH